MTVAGRHRSDGTDPFGGFVAYIGSVNSEPRPPRLSELHSGIVLKYVKCKVHRYHIRRVHARGN